MPPSIGKRSAVKEWAPKKRHETHARTADTVIDSSGWYVCTCCPDLRSGDLRGLGIGDSTADDGTLPAYVRRYPGSEDTDICFSGAVRATTKLGPPFTEPVNLNGPMHKVES